MADRDKVLKGLECCSGALGCAVCPYEELRHGGMIDTCTSQLAYEALGLQRIKTVKKSLEGSGSTWWYVCEECRMPVDYRDKYCKGCGGRFDED